MKNFISLLCVILMLFSTVSNCTADGDEGVEYPAYEEESEETLSDDSRTMYIQGRPFVRLRQTDSTVKPYLDIMPYGSEVTVVATQYNEFGEEWSLVIYNEQYGFCMTKFLTNSVSVSAYEMHPQTMEEAFGSTLLQKGNKTPSYRVKNLQLCLIDGGFLSSSIGADGYFGGQTYKALCAFQKSQDLFQAGRAGKTTKTRLWYIYSDFLMENGVMQ